MEGLLPYLRRILFGEPKPKSVWTLYATQKQVMLWTDHDGTDLDETITFYLWIDEQGNRDYTMHEYGYCESYKKHKNYVADVFTWKHGGSLPQ